MKTENTQFQLLVIDDEENMRHMLSTLLSKLGYSVSTAQDGSSALERVKNKSFDFILCDIKMPKMDGMEFLKNAKEYLEKTTVIMMSAYGTIDIAIEAMKLGAYDYISKPFKTDEVYLALKKAEERERLKRENLLLKERIKTIEQKYLFSKMIGKSKEIQNVFRLATKAANYDTTVIVYGESGTGKELIARGIHFEGNRSKKPFIPVNCGGIPENLLESEFFGYEKGAFTGADRPKKGLFENADGGTLFLDEIGELPLSLQVNFLRVLQENEIRPVGANHTRKINVRVMAATSRNLEEEVKRGAFRQDLFYRLNVFPIKIPPLRDRREDIPILCQHFLNSFRKSLVKDIEGISTDAMSALIQYSWPGNVRELENLIERAIILADQKILTLEYFPNFHCEKGTIKELEDHYSGFSLKEAQQVMEKLLIIRALKETKGNRTKATRLLNISHPSLLSKIKAYDIDL